MVYKNIKIEEGVEICKYNSANDCTKLHRIARLREEQNNSINKGIYPTNTQLCPKEQ
jgi:exo-beta-1,3-glucanase (GH17 family)